MRLLIIIICFLLIDLMGQQNPEWKAFISGVNEINSISARGNEIWSSTDGGLVRLNTITGQSEIFDRTNLNINSYFVSTNFIDNNGNLWFATSNSIYKYELISGTLTRYVLNNIGWDGSGQVKKIKQDSFGNLWFGIYHSSSWGGLLKFDGINWTPYTIFNSSLLSPKVQDFCFDNAGNIWIATSGDYLLKFDGINCIQYNYNNSPVHPYINSVTVDNQNNLWIGFSTLGLMKYNGVNWSTYNTLNSGLPTDYINGLNTDSQNNLWILSSPNGVIKYNGQSWLYFNSSNSPLKNCQSLALDENNNLYVGGKGNIHKFNGSDWNTFTFSGIPPFDAIHSVAIDSSGNKWFGSPYSGLLKFNGITWEIIDTSNSPLPNIQVKDLSFNQQSGLWVATSEALVNINENNWDFYDSNNSPLNGIITCLLVDENNKKWIGTFYNGLFYASSNMGQWLNFNTQNSGIGYNSVKKIYKDSFNKIWILGFSNNQPVNSFNGITFQSHDTINALLGIVYDVEEDNQGNIWFAGQNGLVRLSGSNVIFYNSLNSGLPGNLVTSIAKDIDGSLWFYCNLDGPPFTALVNLHGNQWTILDGSNAPIYGSYFEIEIDKMGNKILHKSSNWVGDAVILFYRQSGVVLSSDERMNSQPAMIDNFILEQNYPNPFNPSTRISWQSPIGSRQTLIVYDVLGNEVTTLVDEYRDAGRYEVEFDASGLASGVYFYKLQSGPFTQVRKMIIIK